MLKLVERPARDIRDCTKARPVQHLSLTGQKEGCQSDLEQGWYSARVLVNGLGGCEKPA